MTTLVIETNRGERYLVNDRNEIIRTDQPDFVPSGGWLFRGLQHRTRTYTGEGLNERAFIRPADLRAMLERCETPDWLFKKGSPRFTVADSDGGTCRNWGGMAGRNLPYGVRRVYLQF